MEDNEADGAFSASTSDFKIVYLKAMSFKFFRHRSASCSVLRKNQRAGFTLIEIMIVLTLIGGIAALVIKNVTGSLQEGKQKTTKTTIRQLQGALDDYYRQCNSYPTTAQGLAALAAKPTVAPDCPNYPPMPILTKLPKDGWDQPFIYINDDGGMKYTLKSLGADKKEAGDGYNKDLDLSDPDF